jgi:D-alanine-D-alanine ligase-like ATP-grasp enzyme
MAVVNHDLERFSVRLNSLSRGFFAPADHVSQFAAPVTDRFFNLVGSAMAKIALRLGLATKVTTPDEHFSETAQCLAEEARARGIEMYEVRPLGLPRNQFVAEWRGQTVIFQGIPRPPRRQKSLLWIDDKAEMKKRFLKAGFPVARGALVKSEHQALAVFHTLQKPVIVKPQEGSGGRHTRVHIETEEELRDAYRIARIVSRGVIVEEELYGPIYRATLIDKKLVAVLRRDPPHIVGDGQRTVHELVLEENKNPLRRGPVFADINPNSSAARRELARQKMTLESIPDKGQIVFFNFKVNWGVGGISYDATPDTHPDNRKLFEDIGAYLGDDIVGIDFIISDISRSWKETPRSGVIELNSLPLIGNHHFPYHGPVVNVAGAVWEMVFPGSGT